MHVIDHIGIACLERENPFNVVYMVVDQKVQA